MLISKSVLSNDFRLRLSRGVPLLFAARISEAANALSTHNFSHLLFGQAIRKANIADKPALLNIGLRP